ncbi:MAG TPA: pirin family protein [Gammaproteobacteria bacterium]|nr:pirin family protein [Gammaproteobacteria bacterium]
MQTMKQQHEFRSRGIEQIVTGKATQDGDGVKLTRVLTQRLQHRLDPFLMLDEFRSDSADDYAGGFPNHPHRGFETVTYMLAGRMRHRDSAGNEGRLDAGGMQWMTAGHGVIHSEMPEQEEGLMHGFQLWVNLPAKNKLMDYAYQDVPAADIPEKRLEDGTLLRLIAGHSHDTDGAVQRADTAPLYLDVHLPANTVFEQPLPEGHNAFAYVYEGAVSVLDRHADERQMAVFNNQPGADGVQIATGNKPARLLLIAGKPLKESIAQYGPFVMNTSEQLEQAIGDYQRGELVAH